MNINDLLKMKAGDKIRWDDPNTGDSRVLVLAEAPKWSKDERRITFITTKCGGQFPVLREEVSIPSQALAKNASEMDPVVGMGATYSIGSDLYPCTVTAVRKNGREIDVTWDDRKDGKFVQNPKSEVRTFTLRLKGFFREKGQTVGFLFLGVRTFYQDPDR